MTKIVDIALSQYGVSEVPGSEKHNETIVSYAREIGLNWVKDDETSWCSIFVNWCAMKAGCEMSRKANARSWLKVGEATATPEMGDIVVFWRESQDSWKGHVGIFINRIGNNIYCLGGNQKNQVCIQAHKASRVLGFRKI